MQSRWKHLERVCKDHNRRNMTTIWNWNFNITHLLESNNNIWESIKGEILKCVSETYIMLLHLSPWFLMEHLKAFLPAWSWIPSNSRHQQNIVKELRREGYEIWRRRWTVTLLGFDLVGWWLGIDFLTSLNWNKQALLVIFYRHSMTTKYLQWELPLRIWILFFHENASLPMGLTLNQKQAQQSNVGPI